MIKKHTSQILQYKDKVREVLLPMKLFLARGLLHGY